MKRINRHRTRPPLTLIQQRSLDWHKRTTLRCLIAEHSLKILDGYVEYVFGVVRHREWDVQPVYRRNAVSQGEGVYVRRSTTFTD